MGAEERDASQGGRRFKPIARRRASRDAAAGTATPAAAAAAAAAADAAVASAAAAPDAAAGREVSTGAERGASSGGDDLASRRPSEAEVGREASCAPEMGVRIADASSRASAHGRVPQPAPLPSPIGVQPTGLPPPIEVRGCPSLALTRTLALALNLALALPLTLTLTLPDPLRALPLPYPYRSLQGAAARGGRTQPALATRRVACGGVACGRAAWRQLTRTPPPLAALE